MRNAVEPVAGVPHDTRFSDIKHLHLSLLQQETRILVIIPLRSVFLTVNAGLLVPITEAAR